MRDTFGATVLEWRECNEDMDMNWLSGYLPTVNYSFWSANFTVLLGLFIHSWSLYKLTQIKTSVRVISSFLKCVLHGYFKILMSSVAKFSIMPKL